MSHFLANCAQKLATIGMVVAFLCQPVLRTEAGEKTYNPAKNLARMNCGAQIEWVSPAGRGAAVPIVGEQNKSPTALLWDDNTLSCPLPEGDTTFVITLPKIALLDRFAFINENGRARGEVHLAVSNYRLSPNDSKWTRVDGPTRLTVNGRFNLSMVGVEAKYVKASFHIEKEGRLAGLGLYGEPTLQGFAEQHDPNLQSAYMLASARPRTRPEDTLNFNFANLYARARVVQVSSGSLPLARRMIDDDVVTAFSFSPSDPNPTAIIELDESKRLNRVSAVYQMEGARLDVYLLNDLTQDGGDLRNTKPVASVVDAVGGKAAVDFEPRGARYVALRWTRQKAKNGSFEVAEVGAFSFMPLSVLDLAEAPSFVQTDFSNTLGTLADPPAIVPVSP